jgi:hypothetical protein
VKIPAIGTQVKVPKSVRLQKSVEVPIAGIVSDFSIGIDVYW